jgi:hypothetical protein
MSTDGDSGGRPAQRPGTSLDGSPGVGPESGDRERVANALAYPLAGGAAAAVLCVVVLAALDPTPGRQLRGLLVLVALVCLLAVAWGWARTVWYGPTPKPPDEGAGGDHGYAERRDVGHVE